MGKHDVGGEPINESIELHYKEKIKLLENKIKELEDQGADHELTINRLHIRFQEKDAYIEELRTALVEQTILATINKGGKA